MVSQIIAQVDQGWRQPDDHGSPSDSSGAAGLVILAIVVVALLAILRNSGEEAALRFLVGSSFLVALGFGIYRGSVGMFFGMLVVLLVAGGFCLVIAKDIHNQ